MLTIKGVSSRLSLTVHGVCTSCTCVKCSGCSSASFGVVGRFEKFFTTTQQLVDPPMGFQNFTLPTKNGCPRQNLLSKFFNFIYIAEAHHLCSTKGAMAGKGKNGVKGERIKRNPSPQPKYLNCISPPRHESSDSQNGTKKAVGTVKNEAQGILHSYSFGTLLLTS